MPDVNDVINGLERCLVVGCDDCNQPDKSGYPWDCEGFDRMVNDAIALLKAQEPRVMTLEEIMMFDGAFIVEYNPERLSRCMNWAMFHFMDEKWVHIWRPRMVEHYAREQYGFTWRCWTSRPTDAQREATSWD